MLAKFFETTIETLSSVKDFLKEVLTTLQSIIPQIKLNKTKAFFMMTILSVNE